MDQKALEMARRAAAVDEIQLLMAQYVQNVQKMDYKTNLETLMAADHPDVCFEYMESGMYKGPEQVRAYMLALHETFQKPFEKTGYMGLQHLTTPKVILNESLDRACGEWTILSPWAKQACPYPGDERKLTAMWFVGRYANEFIKADGQWKILKLHLVSYVRTPFDQGWMRQPDAMRVPPIPQLRPDEPPRYYTFHPDCVYSFDNIYNWGPYLPEKI